MYSHMCAWICAFTWYLHGVKVVHVLGDAVHGLTGPGDEQPVGAFQWSETLVPDPHKVGLQTSMKKGSYGLLHFFFFFFLLSPNR